MIHGIILEANYAKQNSSRGMLLEAKWNYSRSKMELFTKQNIGSKMQVFTKHFPRSIPEAKIMLPGLFKKKKRSGISGRGPRRKYSRRKMESFKESIHLETSRSIFYPPSEETFRSGKRGRSLRKWTAGRQPLTNRLDVDSLRK